MSEPSGCASRTSNFLPDEQSCDSATLDTIAKLLTDGLSDTGDPAAACSEEDMRVTVTGYLRIVAYRVRAGARVGAVD